MTGAAIPVIPIRGHTHWPLYQGGDIFHTMLGSRRRAAQLICPDDVDVQRAARQRCHGTA